ncbi:MAG TPA: hypothetical protein VFI14_10165 [Chryseosolibacter sp.]|nr:hypothetical protein [Chryseosolibacter sp.]
MIRYSVLALPIFLLFAGGRALAQTTHEQEKTNEVKQEPAKETATNADKPSPVVKVVPPARARNAKPARVSPAKARSARPGGARPARNPKPSARPPKPRNGRN